MATVPPPQGMNEGDYEAIEAAVTETVRGRWFLSEFARRNRLAETRQLLDAMSRIEAAVVSGPSALPSADPSVRLLIQRIKEIAAGLDVVADDMRDAGVPAHLVEAVESQARAVAGMMRSATPPLTGQPVPGRLASPPPAALPPREPKLDPSPVPPGPRMPKADLPPSLAAPPPVQGRQPAWPPPQVDADDPRLAALSAFDDLPLAKKLAAFG